MRSDSHLHCKLGFFATVFAPLDIGFTAEQSGAFLADVCRHHKRPDIHPHAVVQIWIPAVCLFRNRFPADENVVRRLAVEDAVQVLLQGSGVDQAGFRRAVRSLGRFKVANPVAEVGEGERFQQLVALLAVGQAVVVDQGLEARLVPVPDVPDERAVLEQLAVLFEEPVAEPLVERLVGEPGLGQQLTVS